MTDRPAAAPADPSAPPLGRSLRSRLLQGFAGVLILIGLAALGYTLLYGRFRESTDNAYVAGNLVQVTPQLAGTVVAIHADDTDLVAAGQPLVELDRADSEVALAQADAQLAKTVRDVRALYAATDALKEQLAVRSSEVARARDDLARRESLAASGAVSGEELEHARTALTGASAAAASARQQWESNRAQTEGTDVSSHPLVQQAAGKVREAYLGYARCVIQAPLGGYVARRTVQVGERVQTGAALLTIVPLAGVWVEANLKENQLANLRLGQPASVVADVYGSAVEYHGVVEGLAAGTGTVFSLLPAQNATGNWIKVVQRLPVRIVLDADQVRAHPLRVGLSMRVVVDTRDRSGAQLATAAPTAARFTTASEERAVTEADARIAAIIRANAAAAGHGRTLSAQRAPLAHPARGG
jgi:membrane fusion protein (multidrug efflux system)